ncbi:hypothetical protein [Phytopseudomonas dryadis]|uniref:Uncharacterized protein n=1 Tax=Phytopseudomonas dryadis TaxID=2487520 RepID=A0A4Q9QW11_9GAMM|nr:MULTISPECIES: hypothetical protein [Pseudomonas]TBU87024.1 hypothetical protein DNK44_21565 [Pseudomonas dryadis]TBV02076.1 hypothetical protein DNK34_19780 [Pseudomonas dryadis]TBV14817.1 hypothetical protein DNK41_19060 [Pseudomonas sp. FRB 230]
MGEAKRKKQERSAWPDADNFRGTIDLHVLPPVAAINGARIRELTGETVIKESAQVVLQTFKAVVESRTFHVGFCLGDGESFSAVGIAVIERLAMEMPEAVLHVVPIAHEDIAWDIVTRHLRCFTGQVLLFAFPNSDVYDAGTAQISYSKHIRQFNPQGQQISRLTDAQRRRILEQKAAILDHPPPPKFYAAQGETQEDCPWIFRITTPAGKAIRTAVWNGRRDYAHEFPADIVQWVGGDKIAIVQVDSPVGVNRRSSLDLTHRLAKDFDGVIHWARDTETFQSILRSFIRLDLDSVSPPELPEGWAPDIKILTVGGAANGENDEEG